MWGAGWGYWGWGWWFWLFWVVLIFHMGDSLERRQKGARGAS
jgi:hypothetical protein